MNSFLSYKQFVWVFKDRWQRQDGSWWQTNPTGGDPIPMLMNNNGFHIQVPEELLVSALVQRHPKIGVKVQEVEDWKAKARDLVQGMTNNKSISDQDLLCVMGPCENLLKSAVSVLEEVYWRLKRDKNKEADKLGVAIHDGKNIMQKLNLCIWSYQRGKPIVPAPKVWSDVLPFIRDNSGFWQVYNMVCGVPKKVEMEEVSHAL